MRALALLPCLLLLAMTPAAPAHSGGEIKPCYHNLARYQGA